ncbi:MAG: hypothetical protein RR382_02510 [Tannerellaceae bacterium]
MKRSIKHFPEQTKEELQVLLSLIEEYIPECSVILFGSYGRGDYVVWEEKDEFGVKQVYQDDYDLMVIISSWNDVDVEGLEDRLYVKVLSKYHLRLKNRPHASPHMRLKCANQVNMGFARGVDFYVDVIKQGIKIYDNKKVKIRISSKHEIYEQCNHIENDYQNKYICGCSLIEAAAFIYRREDYKDALLQLNRACGFFYAAILKVFTNYSPKNNKLDQLVLLTNGYSSELSVIFPRSTSWESHCFDLLNRAFVEVPINKDFAVSEAELDYLFEQIDLLRQITDSICRLQITHYKTEMLRASKE